MNDHGKITGKYAAVDQDEGGQGKHASEIDLLVLKSTIAEAKLSPKRTKVANET